MATRGYVLKGHGGQYEKGADFSNHVVTDGRLVTGQKAASSSDAAIALPRLK